MELLEVKDLRTYYFTSKGVVKAVVLERVEGIKVYGYAALNFLFKLKGGIEITVLKLIS